MGCIPPPWWAALARPVGVVLGYAGVVGLLLLLRG